MEKLLVLGPRYREGKTIGGAVVLFENLVDELNKKRVPFNLIDTNKASHGSRLNCLCKVLYQTAKQIKNHDIIFINSSEDYLILLPPILFLNLFHRKKIFLRKFGGELDRSLEHKIKGPLIRRFFPKLTGLFLESKFLVEKFSDINPNVFWFPNVRRKHSSKHQMGRVLFSGKFVFISQIKYSKGVKELVEAFADSKNNCTLDFYGPLMNLELQEIIENGRNVSYKGELKPKEVYSTLNQYDVLILPTYYIGEGYPGIIIEAYACGKPVIATNWKSIPEIVDNEKTGYLIESRSSLAISEAVERMDDDIYKEMAQNALKKFQDFDSDLVTDRILNVLTSSLDTSRSTIKGRVLGAYDVINLKMLLSKRAALFSKGLKSTIISMARMSQEKPKLTQKSD